MTMTRNRQLGAEVVVLLGAGILGGCTTTAPDLHPETAAKLQGRLHSLAQVAADKNIPAARTELDLLAADVSAAAAKWPLNQEPARNPEHH